MTVSVNVKAETFHILKKQNNILKKPHHTVILKKNKHHKWKSFAYFSRF